MKKQEKTSVASILTALLLLISIGFPHLSAEAETTALEEPQDVVEAVKASPLVQAEISSARKRIKAKESSQEEIKIIGLGSGCGFAGCSASYLAVITVHRRGVNPQSANVLALVRRSPRGELGRVSVVELKEKGQPETRLEILRRYSSPSPTIERK